MHDFNANNNGNKGCFFSADFKISTSLIHIDEVHSGK